MSYSQKFKNHCDTLEHQKVSPEFLETIKKEYSYEKKLPYRASIAALGAIFISCGHLFFHI
jgi:hypothetical protein